MNNRRRNVSIAESILRKIVDDDHTIINDGGYLVMEGEAWGHDDLGDRIVDLTDDEFAYLKAVLGASEQPLDGGAA